MRYLVALAAPPASCVVLDIEDQGGAGRFMR